MRMNYKSYPSDYIQELKQRGVAGRKKSRAFMEYFNDMQHDEQNAYSFYAVSWDVSKSTAHTWIDEFKHEIDLFFSHWFFKNEQHYNYAKNQGERQSNDNRTQTSSTTPLNANFQETHRTTTERQPNEALNIYNNNTRSGFLFDKEFGDLYFVYSKNTNYPGKKQEAYEAFKRVDIDVDLLKICAIKYLHDKVVDKPVGIKKFLENEMYIPYLPNYVRVKSGETWYEGIYDTKSYEFKTQEGDLLGTIEPKLLIELYDKKELIYLKQLSAKAS